MTPSPETLRAILVRLEAATGPDREWDAWLWEVLVGPVVWMPLSGPQMAGAPYAAVPCLTGSLDAAVALIERILPDAYWQTDSNGGAWVRIGDADIADIWNAPTPALALCTALVKALLAQATTN